MYCAVGATFISAAAADCRLIDRINPPPAVVTATATGPATAVPQESTGRYPVPREPTLTPAQQRSASAEKLAAQLQKLRETLAPYTPITADPVVAVLQEDDADDAGAADQEVLEAIEKCSGAIVPCAEGFGVAINDSEDDSEDASEVVSPIGNPGEGVDLPAAPSREEDSVTELGRTESHQSLRILQRRAAAEAAAGCSC